MLCSMWDLPGPGLEPVSPALAGRFLTTAPPGKPTTTISDTACHSAGRAGQADRVSCFHTLLSPPIQVPFDSSLWSPVPKGNTFPESLLRCSWHHRSQGAASAPSSRGSRRFSPRVTAWYGLGSGSDSGQLRASDGWHCSLTLSSFV